MASEYRNICDICGKETKGFCTNEKTDKALAQDNWDIRIGNIWWEGDDYPKELKRDIEVSWDACLDCAKEAAQVLKEWKEKK